MLNWVEHRGTYNIIELEQLSKDWKSPIYAFYHPIPDVAYVNEWCCHEFKCAGRGCKYKARRYLDTKDKSSTGNLIKHVRACWGEEAWAVANKCKDAAEARVVVTKPLAKNGSITKVFKRLGKKVVAYSTQMNSKSETRYARY